MAGSGARRVEWRMTLLGGPSQYGPVENPPSVGGRCRSPYGVASQSSRSAASTGPLLAPMSPLVESLQIRSGARPERSHEVPS